MQQVIWGKCTGDVWCSLTRLNLQTLNGVGGVYIIWHGGNAPRVVRVGQGDIGARLADHRKDPEILAYQQRGELFVTWAPAPANLLGGIEAHLADKWNPLVGDRFPNVPKIAVNSPWS